MKKTKTIITIVASILILIFMGGFIGTFSLGKKSNDASKGMNEYLSLSNNRYIQFSAIIDYDRYILLSGNSIMLPNYNLLFRDISKNTNLNNGIKLDYKDKYAESIDFKISWDRENTEYAKENNVKEFVTIKKDLINKKVVTIKAIDYFEEKIKFSIIDKKTKKEISSFTIDMLINNDYEDSSKFVIYDYTAGKDSEKVAFKDNKFFVLKYDNRYIFNDDVVFKKGTIIRGDLENNGTPELKIKLGLSDELKNYIKSNNLDFKLNETFNFKTSSFSTMGFTSLDLNNLFLVPGKLDNFHIEDMKTIYKLLSNEKLADVPHLKFVKFNVSDFENTTTELGVRLDLEQIKNLIDSAGK